MAWSKSLNNKFAKIQPKEEEKKQRSSFYDDYKARSGSNNNSVSFTPSVKAKTSGSAGSSTVSKQSGGSKKAAPTTVLGNDTKYFKGFQSYQDRKKTGNVFTPSTVLGKHDNRFSRQNIESMKSKQWRGSYGVMPAPTRVTDGNNAASEKKPGFGKWLVDNMMNGVGQFNRSIASTADFILPTAKDFGGDSTIDRIIDYYKGDADRLAAKAAHTNEIKGGKWNTAGNLMSSTIAAVPNAVIAMMTGGASAGSNILGGSVSGGLGQTLFTSAQQLVKNPMFWTSFAQTAGNSYDEAKADGASNLEATATAMISSLLNAGVEIGGGIETIPNETRSIKNWVKGMMDEGKEEVIQGIVEQATRKAVYDRNKKLISTSDENAVINPQRAGKEFAGGAVVGGVLGGVQMGAGAAINNYNDTVNTGREFRDMGEVQSVVDTGKASDNNTSAYKYANRLQQKQSRGADLSDWNIGRQYQKNVRAIQSENEFAAAMSNIKPTEITDSLFNDAGQELNGMASESGVRVSTNGNQDIPTSIKHEWSHMFKMLAPEAYQEYENTIINAAEETNRSAVKNRMDFLKDNYGYSEEVIREEIVAELSGGFNSKAMQRMAEGNQTLAAAIADATRTAKAKLRTAFTDGKYTSFTGLQATFEQLNNAEKQLLRGLEKARNNTQINSEIRYSIHNIRGKNNDYGTGVYLDTNIFDGIKPRYWNKVLSKYVYDNLAGQSLTLYDNNGNNEVISFAKKNERVTKDGANNSHKVIDKLSRTKGNANSLGIVHIDELLQTAIDDGINNENSHNWLDKNGWIFKKAYMQDKNGKIYETTLNIAKAADGRNILYALSNTKQIDEGDVPSAHNNERGSHTNRLSVKDSIPNPNGNVKYSLKENAESNVGNIDKYTYDVLTQKADMPITTLTENPLINSNGKLNRTDVLTKAIANIRAKNNPNNTENTSFVYVKDVDKNLLVGKDALRHGLMRNSEDTAKVTMQIGDILENAIKVNELKPRDNTTGGYVLMGIGADDNGNYYPTRIIVNNYEVQAIEPLEVVYAVRAKKKNQSPDGAGFASKETPLYKGSSKVSIADFLDIVKDNFADTLPQDVLNKYGMERPKSALSDSVRYSLKENGEALPRFIPCKLWEDAVRAAAENKGQASNNENVTRYSVKMDRSGNPYVEIDGDILDGVAPKDRVSTVKNIIKEKFGAPVQTDNGDVAVNRTSRNEYMYSEYTQKLGNTIRVDKFRMANNLDEIIQNQSRVRFESPKHPRKDNFVGFERGEVNVRVGNNDYTAEVIVGVTSVDRKVFYDVINLNPITIEDTISMQDGTTKAPSDSTNTVSSTDIIYENEPIVKNSLKENGQRPRFIPRKNGGKTERPVFVPRKNGGGAVRPVFRMRERTEERPVFIPRMKTDAQLTNDGKNDKISNKVLLPDGTYSKLTDGTEISDIEVFAGKGSNRELRVRYHLMNNYGGQADNWQHTKGRGFVDVNGESRKAMLHWFEEESVGVVERKVKGWSKK